MSFGIAVGMVPVGIRVSSTDDWIYVRAVVRLVHHGVVHVPDLAVVTLLFQLVWGALFAALPLPALVATRLSTLVLFVAGAIALYDVLGRLRVGRDRRVLGTAMYLFHPLAFVLAFTFMSDVPYVSLLLIATACFVRAFVGGTVDRRWALLGGVASAAALLVRQQGALIPAAVVGYLWWTRRRPLPRPRLIVVAEVVGLPLFTAFGYLLFLNFVNGVPSTQGVFLEEIVAAGVRGGIVLVGQVLFITLMYAGLFVVPVSLSAASRLPQLLGGLPRRGLLAVAAWMSVLSVGVVGFSASGRLMPYVGQYLHVAGLGADDVPGGRLPLLTLNGQRGLTILAIVVSLATASLVARSLTPPRRVRRGLGLVVWITISQIVGAILPSFHFREVPPELPLLTLDRYLLPLLPLAIVLTLVALRGVALPRALPWGIVGALAIVSVAGTRDGLVMHDAVWRLADRTVRSGVHPRAIDAGAGWNGWNTSDGSVDLTIPRAPDASWWVVAFTPRTTADYVVSTMPLEGFAVVRSRPYSAWLDPRPQRVYLLRRLPVR